MHHQGHELPRGVTCASTGAAIAVEGEHARGVSSRAMPRLLVMRPELHTLTTAALVFILGAVAPSCAADPVPVRDCTPGASLACACVGGSTGAQLCDGAGHLGACACPDASTGDPRDGSADGDGPELAPDVAAVDGAGLDGAALDGAQPADAPAVDGGDGRCPGLLFMCGTACRTLTERDSCGLCGNVCPDGWMCEPRAVAGACVPPDAGADGGG